MSTTEGRRSSDDLYATIGALACLIEDAAQTKRRLQLSIEVARLVEVVALLNAGYRNGKAVEQEAAKQVCERAGFKIGDLVYVRHYHSSGETDDYSVARVVDFVKGDAEVKFLSDGLCESYPLDRLDLMAGAK